MSKNHHQNKAEQINNRVHDKAQSEKKKMPYQKNGAIRSENAQDNQAADDSSIQLRAYQIYNEKGGSALDNWLEAEQTLKNIASFDSGYVVESEPNTYTKVNSRAPKVDIYR